jgi:hypothetical protein
MRIATLLVLSLIASSTYAEGPALKGRVVAPGDQPLSGARVILYTAAVRTGTSSMCPSCWVDCAKSATSDANGRFEIASLDPQLIFRVLVVAEGYKPSFIEKVDPAAAEVEAKLIPVPADLDPARVLRGRVLNDLGRPVVGASVSPWGARVGERRWWGRVDEVDPVAVTNAAGDFALVCNTAQMAVDLEVEARGLATARFSLLCPGAPPYTLALGQGATVTGRLVKDGKPLAGVEVGMVSADRGMEKMAGPYRVGTDADGRFTFTSVVPDRDYVVYGAMTALAGRGAAGVKKVTVHGHGTAADAGDLPVGPAHRLAGRVVLSDGKPLPPGTRVMLSRDSAWDTQAAVADAEGRFSFDGVPPSECVGLSVRVKGYHLSDSNDSLDRLNGFSLQGKVDADIIDLHVQLDPGPGPYPSANRSGPEGDRIAKDWRRTRETRIAGVRPKP